MRARDVIWKAGAVLALIVTFPVMYPIYRLGSGLPRPHPWRRAWRELIDDWRRDWAQPEDGE